MTFVVPFDGSKLAKAALVRAVEYSTALEEDVTAVTVIPERKRYAREKGWIEENEPRLNTPFRSPTSPML